MRYPYIIIRGGLAGASAIGGIRARDPDGKILLLSRENHPPYQRPPLSKDLWFGKTTLEQIPVHRDEYYRENGVEVRLRHAGGTRGEQAHGVQVRGDGAASVLARKRVVHVGRGQPDFDDTD